MHDYYGRGPVRTIETIATVLPDGTIVAPAPVGLAPGEHRVVIVVEESGATKSAHLLRGFPVDEYGPWPERLPLRREDMGCDDRKDAVTERLPSRPPLRLSAYSLAPTSSTMTFRREDIYDDDGR